MTFADYWNAVLLPMAKMYNLPVTQTKNVAEMAWHEARSAERREQQSSKRGGE